MILEKEALLLVEAVALGVAVAAPVGPMSLFSIRTTLAKGYATGLLAGLGIATGDTLYACIAAFGLGALSKLVRGHETMIELVGGLFLVVLGVLIMRGSTARRREPPDEAAGLRAYTTTLLLTLANPPTILLFGAVFAAAGLVEDDDSAARAAWVVFGVFLGSAGWWLMVTTLVDRWRNAVTGRVFAWINRVSGAIILAFGVVAIIAGLFWR